MLRWHESYFDTWPLGRLIHALGGAGLALERLEELPDPNRWGRREVRVPGDLIVIARKPLARFLTSGRRRWTWRDLANQRRVPLRPGRIRPTVSAAM